MLYADVILPFPLKQTYTYALPNTLDETLAVGMRVVVPFGARRFYTGIVARITSEAPNYDTIKSIVAQLDDFPIVRPQQLRFWQWMSSYYRASLGEVYKTALPSALKLESETHVELTHDIVPENLTKKEQAICEFLSDNKPHDITSINSALDVKDSYPTLKRLLSRGVVALSETLEEQYKPRTEIIVKLSDEFTETSNFDVQKLLARAKKQQQLLLAYFELSPERAFVRRTDLLAHAGLSASICSALVERGIFTQSEQVVSRLQTFEKSAENAQLTDEQQVAFDAICNSFETKNTVLLHGVTTSGKTEIYMRLIDETLRKGKQILYLVPEIALTTQLTARLKTVFGEKLGVYHSRLSDAERVEVWNNLLGDEACQIIIGSRSALFLPFENLGLVIVDEEHDASYKQSDTAPRFHTRNAALVLAAQFGAKTILGSATPSIESYCNALSGKFGLVELKSRYAQVESPEIVPVNLSEAYRKKQMTGHLSDFLVEKINETLARGEQVILFQNRRGFAPYTECSECGWVPRCPHCDVSLTYHKAFNKQTCHYCGYTLTMPDVCPDCGKPALKTHGFGTEQIENEIAEIFPNARVGRMDLDTTRTKKAFANIIERFENQEIDILIGTQMVAKGLDFSGVGLVGILNADNLLNYPDFRAHERAFQMLTQVSGRAGRSVRRGLVVLQTSQPEHPVIQEVVRGDYRAFFEREMAERRQFNYPPYCRLMQIVLKHRDAQTLNNAAYRLANSLRRQFGDKVFGPDNPAVGRVQNLFIKHILLKIDSTESPEQPKRQVDELVQNLRRQEAFRALQIAFDVEL